MAARKCQGGPGRLATWAVAFAPMLAARYRGHRRDLAPAADAGLERWLSIAESDILDGCATGTELLSRVVTSADASAVSETGGEVLALLLG